MYCFKANRFSDFLGNVSLRGWATGRPASCSNSRLQRKKIKSALHMEKVGPGPCEKTWRKVGCASAMFWCSDGHLAIPSVAAKAGALFFQWRLSNRRCAWCHWLSFQSQHAGFAILNRTTTWCMIGHSTTKSKDFRYMSCSLQGGSLT